MTEFCKISVTLFGRGKLFALVLLFADRLRPKKKTYRSSSNWPQFCPPTTPNWSPSLNHRDRSISFLFKHLVTLTFICTLKIFCQMATIRGNRPLSWDTFSIADCYTRSKNRGWLGLVWPDDGIKSCPISPNIAQKVAKSFFTWKLYYLK